MTDLQISISLQRQLQRHLQPGAGPKCPFAVINNVLNQFETGRGSYWGAAEIGWIHCVLSRLIRIRDEASCSAVYKYLVEADNAHRYDVKSLLAPQATCPVCRGRGWTASGHLCWIDSDGQSTSTSRKRKEMSLCEAVSYLISDMTDVLKVSDRTKQIGLSVYRDGSEIVLKLKGVLDVLVCFNQGSVPLPPSPHCLWYQEEQTHICEFENFIFSAVFCREALVTANFLLAEV